MTRESWAEGSPELRGARVAYARLGKTAAFIVGSGWQSLSPAARLCSSARLEARVVVCVGVGRRSGSLRTCFETRRAPSKETFTRNQICSKGRHLSQRARFPLLEERQLLIQNAGHHLDLMHHEQLQARVALRRGSGRC